MGPDQFDALTLEKQRLYVRGEVTAIIVKPASRPMNRFDNSRLSGVWRENPSGDLASETA